MYNGTQHVVYFDFVDFAPSANVERAGVTTRTAASHQGATLMIWLSVVISVTSQQNVSRLKRGFFLRLKMSGLTGRERWRLFVSPVADWRPSVL